MMNEPNFPTSAVAMNVSKSCYCLQLHCRLRMLVEQELAHESTQVLYKTLVNVLRML
jgi:hypothetical protein